MTSIQQALRDAMALLTTVSLSPAEKTATGPDHRIDCEVLLAHVLKQSRTYLYTHPEQILTPTELDLWHSLITARCQGTPIAYLTGIREFWSLSLKVSPATLIPRPETELLVELALTLLDNRKKTILDLGTGSGAIALAIATEKPHWHIIACDNSIDALNIARDNAASLQLSNIDFYHSDWFSDIPAKQKFDAILSNPPYIASNDQHLNEGDLRFEPRSALSCDTTGLAALQTIIKESLARLEKNGLLLVEHGFDQKNAVNALLVNYGYRELNCWTDVQGHDRVSGGRRIELAE